MPAAGREMSSPGKEGLYVQHNKYLCQTVNRVLEKKGCTYKTFLKCLAAYITIQYSVPNTYEYGVLAKKDFTFNITNTCARPLTEFWKKKGCTYKTFLKCLAAYL